MLLYIFFLYLHHVLAITKFVKFPLNFDVNDLVLRTKIEFDSEQILNPALSLQTPELILYSNNCKDCYNTGNEMDENSLTKCRNTPFTWNKNDYSAKCYESNLYFEDTLFLIEFFVFIKCNSKHKIYPDDGLFGILPYHTNLDHGIINSLYNINLIANKTVYLNLEDITVNNNQHYLLIGDIDETEDEDKNVKYFWTDKLTSEIPKINISSLSFSNNTIFSDLIATLFLDEYFTYINIDLYNRIINSLQGYEDICSTISILKINQYKILEFRCSNLEDLNNLNVNIFSSLLPLNLTISNFSIVYNDIKDLFYYSSKVNKFVFIFRGKLIVNNTLELGLNYFLNKTNLIFNEDLKQIGFYGRNLIDLDNKPNTHLSTVTICLIVFASITVFCFIIWFIFYDIKRRRRRRIMFALI